jgi:hypothetical protein
MSIWLKFWQRGHLSWTDIVALIELLLFRIITSSEQFHAPVWSEAGFG